MIRYHVLFAIISLLYGILSHAQTLGDRPLNDYLNSNEGLISLNRITRNSPETFNRVKLLDGGMASLLERKKMINEAQNYLFISVPFWDYDPISSEILNSILNKKTVNSDFEFKTTMGWWTPLFSKKGHKITSQIPEEDKVLWNPPTWGRNFSFDIGGHELHDKMFIADGKKLIIGGLNISEHYLLGGAAESGWLDTDILIEGPAAQVASEIFLKIFTIGKYFKSNQNFSPFTTKENGILSEESDIKSLYNYFYLNQERHDFHSVTISGQELSADDILLKNNTTRHRVQIPLLDKLNSSKYFPEITANPEYKTSVRLIYDNPLFDRKLDTQKNEQFSKTQDTIEFLLSKANESAWFFMPYYTTDEDLLNILAKAAKRIDVRIITNSEESNDMSSKMQRKAEAHYEQLLRAGVKIYEFAGNGPLKKLAKDMSCRPDPLQWPGETLHTKMILFDQAVTMIGSHNLDARALKKNNEITALVNDSEFAVQAKAVFDRHFDSLSLKNNIDCYSLDGKSKTKIKMPAMLRQIELN